jgi:uncharacterized Zn-finger protein
MTFLPPAPKTKKKPDLTVVTNAPPTPPGSTASAFKNLLLAAAATKDLPAQANAPFTPQFQSPMYRLGSPTTPTSNFGIMLDSPNVHKEFGLRTPRDGGYNSLYKNVESISMVNFPSPNTTLLTQAIGSLVDSEFAATPTPGPENNDTPKPIDSPADWGTICPELISFPVNAATTPRCKESNDEIGTSASGPSGGKTRPLQVLGQSASNSSATVIRPRVSSGSATEFKIELSTLANSNNGDKPFSCPECFQQFNRKHDLIRHMRIHTNDKPFSCERCGKSFTRLDALKRHQVVSEKYGGKCRIKRGRVPKNLLPGEEMDYEE